MTERDDERAAIVTWLRDLPPPWDERVDPETVSMWCADAIEAGKHLGRRSEAAQPANWACIDCEDDLIADRSLAVREDGLSRCDDCEQNRRTAEARPWDPFAKYASNLSDGRDPATCPHPTTRVDYGANYCHGCAAVVPDLDARKDVCVCGHEREEHEDDGASRACEHGAHNWTCECMGFEKRRERANHVVTHTSGATDADALRVAGSTPLADRGPESAATPNAWPVRDELQALRTVATLARILEKRLPRPVTNGHICGAPDPEVLPLAEALRSGLDALPTATPTPSKAWRVLVNADGEPYAVENGSSRRGVDTDGNVEPNRSGHSSCSTPSIAEVTYRSALEHIRNHMEDDSKLDPSWVLGMAKTALLAGQKGRPDHG